MASAFIVMGSIAGLALAIVSYMFLDVSLMLSVAIWVGSGPLSAVLALLAPRGTAPAQVQGIPQSA